MILLVKILNLLHCLRQRVGRKDLQLNGVVGLLRFLGLRVLFLLGLFSWLRRAAGKRKRSDERKP